MSDSCNASEPRRCCPRIYRNREQVEPAVRARVRQIVAGGGPWPLTLLGPIGCGKSCAALCIADYFQSLGGDAFYWTAGELGGLLAGARCGRLAYPGGGPRSEGALFDDLGRYRVVIIDELGLRQQPTESEYAAVKGVLDIREARPTVLVSNLALGELEIVYDGRVISRLCAGTILRMDGGDRRLGKRRPVAVASGKQ